MFEIRQSITQWWHARIAKRDVHVLTQRTVYILPTAPGWMMGLTLLLLLIASINFQLNLGYLLTFMLGGAIVVGVYLGQASMTGLRLTVLPVQTETTRIATKGFAHSAMQLELQLERVRPKRLRLRTRHAGSPSLGFCVLANDQAAPSPWHMVHWPAQQQGIQAAHLGSPQFAKAAANATFNVTLPLVLHQRGLQDLPTLKVQTLYPLGIFRIWTIWRIQSQALVYPAPEPNPPDWKPHAHAADQGKADSVDKPEPPPQPKPQPLLDEEQDLRGFRVGDAPRQLLWKSVAKRPDTPSAWTVKTTTSSLRPPPPTLHFDVIDARTVDVELALSRLTAWVLQAQQHGNPYGLRLPHIQIAPSTGSTHDAACLQALALA